MELAPGRALPHEHWSSQLVHTLPNDYVLTTLGGSSSCYMHGYGEYIRNRSAGNVTWWNPSQGSSGSDWAALFLDSLVPQNTSVVLWEFAINDWWIRPAGISEANFHQQVLKLFLRRLVHRIPKVTIGIVVLWQPYALKCWPECPRDEMKWNLSLPVLQHYSESIASFAVDANALGKRWFTNRTHLLADRHHPTDAGHAMIAEAVLLHLRSRAAATPSSRDGSLPSLPQACCLAEIDEHVDEASGGAFGGHRLLGARSLVYTTPTLRDFDTRWVPAITTRSEGTVESFGSNSSERSDRKFVARIAPCAKGKNPARYGLVHEVPFEFRYVGINAVQWASGRPRRACSLRVFVDGQESSRLDVPAVLLRPSGMSPQCWNARPQPPLSSTENHQRHRRAALNAPTTVSFCYAGGSDRPVLTGGAVYV